MVRAAKGTRLAREHLLRIVSAAELAGVSVEEARQAYAACFVGDVPEPGPSEATEWHRVERFEDELPSAERWNAVSERVVEATVRIDDHREAIVAAIGHASPRWRLDRMPVIDRALLIVGAAEMVRPDPSKLRPIFHDLIELAKAYGSDSTPRFVNGILDQMRKNLGLPFA